MSPIDIDPNTGAPIIKETSSDFVVPTTTEETTQETTEEKKEEVHSTTTEKPVESSTESKREEGTGGTNKTDGKEPEKKPRKEELLEMIQNCQKEHDGESNIPFNHDYWHWVNEYRRAK